MWLMGLYMGHIPNYVDIWHQPLGGACRHLCLTSLLSFACIQRASSQVCQALSFPLL